MRALSNMSLVVSFHLISLSVQAVLVGGGVRGGGVVR